MPPSSLTLNYDAVYSTALFNFYKAGGIQNQISTANALLFKIMNGPMYKNDAEGLKLQVNLMYAIQNGDSYSGYDVLDTTPTDGITAAFFDWGQWSVPIAISGKEERENAGSDVKIQKLLEAKTTQAVAGIQEGFARAFVQGNGRNTATAITTRYTSPNNASTFIDPLPLLVKFDPTTSTTVGNINQSTYSWWQNKTKTSVATTFSAFLKELDNLYNQCSKGIGGKPNLHFVDQQVFELYVAALRNQNRFTDYTKADIPFENVAFHGQPVTWDEFVPDAQNGTITSIPVAASGTWYMLNTDMFYMNTFPGCDFTPGPFVKPENQDAKVSTILWHGGTGVSNRRKHGVMGAIATTTAA